MEYWMIGLMEVRGRMVCFNEIGCRDFRIADFRYPSFERSGNEGLRIGGLQRMVMRDYAVAAQKMLNYYLP
jgi:hypothetical protein